MTPGIGISHGPPRCTGTERGPGRCPGRAGGSSLGTRVRERVAIAAPFRISRIEVRPWTDSLQGETRGTPTPLSVLLGLSHSMSTEPPEPANESLS